MILIGITGGIACGKTEVSKVFRKKGAVVLSGDRIGKEVAEKNRGILKELVRTFGSQILNKRGGLNRRRLGEIAFASKISKEKLNRMVHPYLLNELRRKIEGLGKKHHRGMVVIDAALIVEWGLQKELDYLIFVQSKREDRIRRLREKKGYSRKESEGRIKSQLPEKTKRKLADFVIKNDKGLDELQERANRVWKKIVSKCDE
ncbi:MAG: dephospho-CoA kinase [Candidatus Zixiibacteriota bacterium]